MWSKSKDIFLPEKSLHAYETKKSLTKPKFIYLRHMFAIGRKSFPFFSIHALVTKFLPNIKVNAYVRMLEFTQPKVPLSLIQ